MSIQTGTEVTIKRGKLAGQVGQVVAGPYGDEYAVTIGGKVTTQKDTNLAVAPEATVTVSQVADVLFKARDESPLNEGVLIGDVARLLEAEGLTGLTARISD